MTSNSYWTRGMGLAVLCAVVFASCWTATASADDAVTPGTLVVERPTLICLGFQWYVGGDDNKNARVTVQYRKAGAEQWRTALDLWYIHGQRCISYGKDDFYEPPHMFAGSIFDLDPGTEYECRLTLIDPDGVEAEATKTITVRTRTEPKPPLDATVLHLGGETPDFTDFRKAVGALSPGSTLLVHKGIYKLSAKGDADYLDNNVFALDVQGTEQRPIAIKAAGDGEVVFDAQGGYLLFDVQNSQHLIIDGLTIRNADFAIHAGSSMPASNDGIVVRNCTYDKIGRKIQGFDRDLTASARETKDGNRPLGRIRHVGGPNKQVAGSEVNPDDGGRVYKTLGNALFGDNRWHERCSRASKKWNDLVQPGDTIVVHKGETLLDHRHKSHWGACFFYNSTIVLNLKGTADKPITIRGEGNPVFDGAGNLRIFDLQGSEHVVIEGLTFKNADYAIYKAKQTVTHAVRGLTVRHCRFENVGCGVYGISGANRDFLITDNTFIGRCRELYTNGKGEGMGDDEASYSAVHLAGQGNIICHNDVYRFFDGLQMDSNWADSPTVNTYWTAGGDEPLELRTSACDIYNNIVRWAPDNSIEADMSHHNIRIMRNLCVDSYCGNWSTQVVMGGPVYWIRNIGYNDSAGFEKGHPGSVGHYYLHNTTANGPIKTWPPGPGNAGVKKMSADTINVYAGNMGVKTDSSAGVFAKAPKTRKDVPTVFRPEDFYPTAENPAIDKAIDSLPNVNDDFSGKAPDLGAIEFGKPLPHYGPRVPSTGEGAK